MAEQLGGKVQGSNVREFGYAQVQLEAESALFHDIRDHVDHPFADFGVAGVEVALVVVDDHPLRVAAHWMVVGKVLQVGFPPPHPVGVEPGVQFQAACVGFCDREFQRIVAGVAALGAGQVAGLRFLV